MQKRSARHRIHIPVNLLVLKLRRPVQGEVLFGGKPRDRLGRHDSIVPALNDPPVTHADNAVRVFRRFRIVGDHQNRLPQPVIQIA